MISIDSGICTCMLVMKTKAAVRKTIDIGVKHSIENIDIRDQLNRSYSKPYINRNPVTT